MPFRIAAVGFPGLKLERDKRAAQYVDSPLMRHRIRQGRRLIVQINGNFGRYRTELDLGSRQSGSCTCPSDEWPCKHIRALRRTWRANPGSFLDIDVVLEELSRRSRGDLIATVGAMILADASCLAALGVSGFDGDEYETDVPADEAAAFTAAGPGRSIAPVPKFTTLQGRYLAFIHTFTRLHGRAPAEADLQRHFRVSPPSVHRMIVTLHSKGLIHRRPGTPRSLRVAVPPEAIPELT